MGFFNFGNNDKEKPKLVYLPEEKKMAYVQQESPYTENGLVLKNVPVEKGVMSPKLRDNPDSRGFRSNQIGGLFGTTDLDYILRAYAPDTIDIIDHLLSNQGNICRGLREIKQQNKELLQQNQELKEMLGKLLQEKNLSNEISR